MSNSVIKEGENQSMQVQGHVLSNNQIDKYCLEEHLLVRSSAEEDTGLVVHMVQTCGCRESKGLVSWALTKP